MADSVKHFLYLLPDVAYAIELVPGKDGVGFAIRDYLQVNGEFMDENVILPVSMEKLVGKLQSQAYDLILPDFLFTNTVVNVDKTGEEEVKRYVNDELVPTLELSKETHNIQSFILTEHKGSAKVQLSALELSVLDPLREAFNGDNGPTIKNIYPLSWTLKSLISLEPSISIVQLGANLYLAQHYIGVDQANNASAEDAEKLVETVKTLKGAEPSIQTMYLLSSALVESKLKDGLKETLPLQQLADESEESEMPSYVKQAVEAGAKTLSVADYKVPVFIMEASQQKAEKAALTAEPKEAMKDSSSTAAEIVLPTPTEIGTDADEDQTKAVEPELEFAEVKEAEVVKDEPEVTEKPAEPEKVDLAQFSSHEEDEDKKAEANEAKPPTVEEDEKEPMKPVESPQPAKKPVIKNDSGVNNMVRMIVIGLISFFVTVGIGLGIGLGLLTFTRPAETEQTTTTPVAEPTAEATPTPTPTPAVSRAEHDVLVVNATTKAGYAGEIADKLEAAGFEDVTSQNAKGDYEEGSYVLLTENDQALVDLLSQDTGLSLEFAEGKEVEDAAESYTVVIVLAQ